MTERIEIITEYMGIEHRAVQQIMRRADRPIGEAETRSRVWDLDGRPYVRCYGRRWYLDEEDAQVAREARTRPYCRMFASSVTA